MSPVWWHEVAPGWGMFLVEVALKSALLIAGLLLADRLLSDRRASWRNLLWHTALAGLILVPLAVALGPSLRVPVPAKAEIIVPTIPRVPATPLVAEKATAPLPVDEPVSESSVAIAGALAEPQAPAWKWPAILVLVYGAGVLFFLGRLGMGLLYVASLRRQAREVRDERFWPALEEFRIRLGIHRPVRLGVSEQVGSPLQVGVFAPMAILPARLLGRLDEQAFRAVAAHELAHVRRWDYLVHMLALVVLAGHWFNPLAWLALRRLHETGEHACDEWAVRLLGRYEVYAGALLDVLGEMRGQRVRWGLGMAYQAEQRLERIMAMKNAIPPGVGRLMGGVMVLGLSAGAVMLGCSALATSTTPSAAPGSVNPGGTPFGPVGSHGNAVALPLAGITVDGKLEDWPKGLETYAIAELSTAYTPVPPAGPRDFSAHYQAGYDAGTLYLAVVVEDDELVTHPEAPSVANQDLCEVYIDADLSGKDQILTGTGFGVAGAQQYIMAPGPGMAFDKVHANPALVGDEQHRSGVKAAFWREGTTTTYEWAIPLYASFPDRPFEARPGKTIGFDVAVVDADGREGGNWISWTPGFKVSNADTYGHLTLLENYQGLGMLSGTLADGQHPGTGVVLEVWRGGLRVASLRTDAQGRYAARLPPEEYTLKVKGGQGFAADSATAMVQAGQETNPRLTLSPVVLPEILRQMAVAYQGLQTYSDTTVLEYRRGDIRWTTVTSFALAQPNKMRVARQGLMAIETMASDGDNVVQYWGHTGEYVRRPAPPRFSAVEIQRTVVAPLLSMLLVGDPERVLFAGLEQASELGREQLDGQPMMVVELRRVLGKLGGFFGWGDRRASVRLWIGEEDHLLHQAAIGLEVGAPNQRAQTVPGGKWEVIERHTAIRANAELPAATFTISLPADAVPAGTLAVPEVPRSMELVGKPAPAFALKNLEGEQARLADFAGKVLIVDLYSPLGGESRIAIPYFIELQAQYGGQGFSVIGLATDPYAHVQAQEVRRFAEDQMINYPVLITDQKVFAAYGRPTHLPTTFIIDKKGVVRHVHLGAPQDLRVYQREVEALLGE